MKPRVLFINLPYVVTNIDSTRPKIRSFHAFPLGLLSVATYNKNHANIRMIDCDSYDVGHRIDLVERTMREFKPSIVGFSMMFDNSYVHLSSFLKLVKSINPDVITVLGGSAASYSYAEILSEQPNLNALCYSEGEIPFRELLLTSTFSNPAWITAEKLNTPPIRSLVSNVDDITAIDYSFCDPVDYDMHEAFSPFAKLHRNCFFMLTSRGCPFKCTFCSNAALHGQNVRQASVDVIINHVKDLVYNYGMETLIIYDDQLLYKPNRAKELFKQLAQFDIRIEAPNGVSVRYIDNEMALLMRAAGMDTVYLAVESGSDYVLHNLIKKPLKLSMVTPAIKALRAADFFIHAFIVLGMPGETDEHREETYRFLLEQDIDWAGINLATPVRGSQLYTDCINNGWIKKQAISDIVDKAYIINFPGTDLAAVEAQAYAMNINVNFHHNRRIRVGDYEVAALCFKQVLQRYGDHTWAKHYLELCHKITQIPIKKEPDYEYCD